jgi:hypothetical protein
MERGFVPAPLGTWDPVERQDHRCERPALGEYAPALGRRPKDGDRWTCAQCGVSWEASCSGWTGRGWVPVRAKSLREV